MIASISCSFLRRSLSLYSIRRWPLSGRDPAALSIFSVNCAGVMLRDFSRSYIGVYCCMKATRSMPGLPPMYALRCISQREVQPIDSTARATRGGSWRERSPWLNCPALYMRSLTASHALSGSMSSGCWISSMISRTSATLGGHLFVAMCFFTASATIPDSSCSNIMAQRFTVASIAFASLNLS